MRFMKRAHRIIPRLVALAFLLSSASGAQNCPAHDTNALPPTALVDSALITVQFHPRISDSILAGGKVRNMHKSRRVKSLNYSAGNGKAIVMGMKRRQSSRKSNRKSQGTDHAARARGQH
jgi:hypothetical protein